MSLDFCSALFDPNSIAIVGASKNPIGGSKYYFALKSSEFIDDSHHVYLINPKFDSLHGEKVYKSLSDPELPKPIDLVIIAVPAKFVPQVVRECDGVAKCGVIYSSGFGESGNQSLDIDLKKAIEETSTRFIGPNGLGILDPYTRVNIYADWPLYKGNISYISQSGGNLARLYIFMGSYGMGFNKAVSIGNAYDITPSELIQDFAHDQQTDLIALYMESIRDGREFYQIAQKITPKKPIVLWKGGQTERGTSAAFSHTGGLAGSYAVWKAMAKQSGIILADHYELFMDLVQVMAIRPYYPETLRVAIVVAGGGIGVEFTDMFEKNGIDVPDYHPTTIERLKKVFPAVNTNFKNPLDTGEMGYHPQLFAKAMEIVLEDPNTDIVVFVREPERFPVISKLLGIADPQKDTIESLARLLKNTKKPVFCNPSMNADTQEAYETRHDFTVKMIADRIPVINYAQNLPNIIKELYSYGKFVKNQKNETKN